MKLNIDVEKYERWKESQDLTKKSAANGLYDMCKAAPGIGIAGDYDVDGICGTFIAETGLRWLFPEKPIISRIPHRFSDGYGLNPSIVDDLASRLPKGSLLLTVDNGISAKAGIARAKELGMKVIITDHHTPPKELPDADLIFDPADERLNPFNFDHFCGAATIYHLLRPFLNEEQKKELSAYSAMATMCDVMPLVQNNWLAVRNLIARIQARDIPRPLKMLLEVHGDVPEYADESTLGFSLGPMINAPGRLWDDGGEVMLDFFKNPSMDKARDICGLNEERIRACKDAMAAAIELLGPEPAMTPLWVKLPEISQGLVGIVAGKLAEKYKRPTICASPTAEDKNILSASARTYGDFNIFEYLNAMCDSFLSFGGHPGAAGLKLTPASFDACSERIHEYTPIPEEWNAEMALSEFKEAYNLFNVGRPYGEGNPAPEIRCDINLANEGVFAQPVGAGSLKITAGSATVMSFGHAAKKLSDQTRFTVIGRFAKNVYRDQLTIQLIADEVIDTPPLIQVPERQARDE